MLRNVLSKLSGGQVTWLATIAILVPGAVTAAVTFQPVAIVDPASGRQSFVDGARRLWVYDSVAAYRNNPANLVEIQIVHSGTKCDSAFDYAVPSGKALVITAISGWEWAAGGEVATGFDVFDGANCSGKMLASHTSSTPAGTQFAPVVIDLGAGVPVKAGRTVSVNSIANSGITFLHGYLVPAGAVPAAFSADAKSEPRPLDMARVKRRSRQ